MKTKVLLSGLLASLLNVGAAHAAEWTFDPAHSSAAFSVKHMVVTNVRGEFSKITGMANLDDKDLSKSTVEFTADVDTISTHEPKRDEHLKSPDFFDAKKFPKVTFKSTKIEKAGEGKYKLVGDLTMHGITKPVTLEVEGPSAAIKSPFGVMVRSVSATGKINRKDWGLSFNKALEGGGLMIGEEVKLDIDVELNAKSAGPA